MLDQVPFGTNNFADNPEPRLPCVLLLDVSGSMGGQPISELNAGVVGFKDDLMADPLAAKRVEVAIVAFGGTVQTACDFTTAGEFHPPALVASGDTPLRQGTTHLELLHPARAYWDGMSLQPQSVC